MSPIIALGILIVYFAILVFISFRTSKGADTNTFFTANKQSARSEERRVGKEC